MRRIWTGLDSRVRLALGAVVALLLAGALVAVFEANPSNQVSSEVGFAASNGDGRALDGAKIEAYADRPQGDLAPLAVGEASGGVAAPTVGADASAQVAPVPPPGGGSGGKGDKVVRTGDLRVELKKGGFRAAFDRASALAVELGGFVAESGTERVGDRLAAGSLTLRVPGPRFDEARRRLAALGKVDSESVHGQDVSGELVDLDARLRSLRAQEDVLRALVGRAKTVGEVIQVEQQLGGVRQQIEQLAAQQAGLTDRVAMATLSVSLFEKGAPVVVPGDDEPVLSRSLDRAVDGALAVIGGTVVVIGYLVPLSVLALAGWGLYRAVARRRRPAPAA